MIKHNVQLDASEGGVPANAQSIAEQIVNFAKEVAAEDVVIARVIQPNLDDLIVCASPEHSAEQIVEAMLEKHAEMVEAVAALRPPVAEAPPAVEDEPKSEEADEVKSKKKK